MECCKLHWSCGRSNWCIGNAMLNEPLALLWLSISVHMLYLQTVQSIFFYSLIAFDERVTFWLQRVRSLHCACAYVALFARRLVYNHYAIAHAYNAANTHTHTKQWPGVLKPKSYSLVQGNRSIALFSV